MTDALKGSQRSLVIERDMQLLQTGYKSALEEFRIRLENLRERCDHQEADVANSLSNVAMIHEQLSAYAKTNDEFRRTQIKEGTKLRIRVQSAISKLDQESFTIKQDISHAMSSVQLSMQKLTEVNEAQTEIEFRQDKFETAVDRLKNSTVRKDQFEQLSTKFNI